MCFFCTSVRALNPFYLLNKVLENVYLKQLIYFHLGLQALIRISMRGILPSFDSHSYTTGIGKTETVASQQQKVKD